MYRGVSLLLFQCVFSTVLLFLSAIFASVYITVVGLLLVTVWMCETCAACWSFVGVLTCAPWGVAQSFGRP